MTACLARPRGEKRTGRAARPAPIPQDPQPTDSHRPGGDRRFRRDGPDQLWVTDITEHPTREGKIYCAAVLDVFSRRVVGWSIDSRSQASFATNALSMAIEPAVRPGAVLRHTFANAACMDTEHKLLAIAGMSECITNPDASAPDNFEDYVTVHLLAWRNQLRGRPPCSRSIWRSIRRQAKRARWSVPPTCP